MISGKIFQYLSDLPILLGKNKKIYIDQSSHIIWSTYRSHPPIRYIRNKKRANMLHCLNQIPLNEEYRPSIIEMEHPLHLMRESRDYRRMIEQAKKIEEYLISDKCKAVIGPTYGSIKKAFRYFENINEIENKFIKISPAINSRGIKNFDILEKMPFTILNIGNKFWGKGTHLVIEMFNRLRKIYKGAIQLIIVCSDVPLNYKLIDGIKILSQHQLHQKMKDELFTKSHLFVFPCLHDSFGVYLECLAYGMPILSTNIYDKSEIVYEGKTGYLFNTPISLYDGEFGVAWRNWDEFIKIVQSSFMNGDFEDLIKNFVNKVELLINKQELLKELSRNTTRLCIEDFNVARRNRSINEMYDRLY